MHHILYSCMFFFFFDYFNKGLYLNYIVLLHIFLNWSTILNWSALVYQSQSSYRKESTSPTRNNEQKNSQEKLDVFNLKKC